LPLPLAEAEMLIATGQAELIENPIF